MNYKKFLSLISTILLSLSLTACQGGSGGSGGGSSEPSQPEAFASKTIGSEGGEVRLISGSQNAIAVIPAGALENSANISINIKKTPPKEIHSSLLKAGNCIKFGPEGTIFKKKVTLGLPYNDSNDDDLIDDTNISVNHIRINYYDPIADNWTNVPVKSLDKSAKIAYFETNHFSNYIVLIPKEFEGSTPDTKVLENEYFVGDQQFNGPPENQIIRKMGCIKHNELPCGQPWHLSVIMHPEKGVYFIIDRHFTENEESGYKLEVSADGTSATFDAKKIFEKIAKTGDARKWKWECEFVKHLTYLTNYKVVSDDDPSYIQTPAAERFYAEITAVDDRYVKLDWKIDIIPEITPGKQMSIRFEARYEPNGAAG